MGVYLATGRNILPNDCWTITTNTTGSLSAGNYYFALQARNRVGYNLPIYSSLVNVPNNGKVIITVNSNALTNAEGWISYVISVNNTLIATDFTVIAEIPLINLNTNVQSNFPLTLELINNNQLVQEEYLANHLLFPTTTVLHGQRKGLNSTTLIYRYDSFDTTTTVDNLLVFNGIAGRWKAIGSFSSYINSVTAADGCSQDIRNITDLSSIVLPTYNSSGSDSIPITLWITSTEEVEAKTNLLLDVFLGSENKTNLFHKKLKLVFKGFVNLTTGIKRVTYTNTNTPLDEIDIEYLFDSQYPVIKLEDILLTSEAFILEIRVNYSAFELDDLVPNGSYISIIPSFSPTSSSYTTAGTITGNVVFNEGNLRRIVPDVGLNAIGLSGSGIIKNYQFPLLGNELISGLQVNIANQKIALNKNGFCYYTAANIPSDAAQRALVSTVAGESKASTYSSPITVTNKSLSITVTHPCDNNGYGTIRSSYPDVIANNSLGKFNAEQVVIYINNGTETRKFTGFNILFTTTQVIELTDFSVGTIVTSLPNTEFGLFSSNIPTVDGTNLGTFNGTYTVAISYLYLGNSITNISHKSTDGNEVFELLNSLVEAVNKTPSKQYFDITDPSNTLGNDDDYYLNTDTYDYFNKSNSSWTLIGSLRGTYWYSGNGVPSDTNGKSNDIYIDVVTSNLYKKSITWILIGNIKGNPGTQIYTASGVPNNSFGSDADFYLNTATSDYYLKISSVWQLQGSLRGIQGVNGATWLNGTSNPTSGQGNVNDFYINTTTSDYYLKTNSTTWTLQGNFKGNPGASGSLTSTGGIVFDNNTVSPTKTSTQLALYSNQGEARITDNTNNEYVLAYLNKNQQFTKAFRYSVTTLTISSGAVVVDCSLSNLYTLTLTSSVTSLTFTNITVGTNFDILIRQDATGGRTITGISTIVKFTGAISTFSMSGGANRADNVSFISYDGINLIGRINAKNFA